MVTELGFSTKNMLQECDPHCELFELVPDEIILRIFSKLPQASLTKCALVSKHWRDIAYDASLWRVVKLGAAVLHDGALENILVRGTSELTISSCTMINFSDATILNGVTQFKIKRLDVKRNDIDCAGVCNLVQRCPELTELSLYLPEFSNRLCALISKFKNLTYLYLGSAEEITLREVSVIVRGCHNLKQFCIDSLYGFTNIKELFEELPDTIEKFHVPHGFLTEIYDEDIAVLVTSCPNISKLNLGYSELLTEKTISPLLKLKRLQKLDVSGCVNIPFSAFWNLHQVELLTVLKVNSKIFAMEQQTLQEHLPHVKIVLKSH